MISTAVVGKYKERISTCCSGEDQRRYRSNAFHERKVQLELYFQFSKFYLLEVLWSILFNSYV